MKYWKVERYAGSNRWALSYPVIAISASEACTLLSVRAAGTGGEYRLRRPITREQFDAQEAQLVGNRR